MAAPNRMAIRIIVIAKASNISFAIPRPEVVLYTGTFEAYQGLDLLFAAMSDVGQTPTPHFSGKITTAPVMFICDKGASPFDDLDAASTCRVAASVFQTRPLPTQSLGTSCAPTASAHR